MSKSVISVSDLGKCYRIGASRERSRGGGARIRRILASPFDYVRTRLRPPEESELLWALRNVSFEVRQGEVLGIIGRNGAGKSTLLKILSRITDPTEGHAEVRGRVNSLLEVGTGFHPELTGRENIYLNAAIHGLRRSEIDRKFDEIVEFSEIGRFIDTPVKRYSSGMYTRLAFGVAAHLEPDVLIVDEVLAVGDMAFQKKCMGKMNTVAKSGRAVLFVSHNMAAMSSLCGRLIHLQDGRVVADGSTETVLPQYISSAASDGGEVSWPAESAPGDEVVRLLSARVIQDGAVTSDVMIDRDVVIEMDYINRRLGAHLMSAIYVTDSMGVGVFSSMNAPSACNAPDPWFDRARPAGLFRARCTIPGNLLSDRSYRVAPLVLSDARLVHVYATDALGFTVHETGVMRKEYHGPWLGVVRPRLGWETEFTGEALGNV
ncbi:MAG: ABC transporter ATP-binding protein [Lentisphaerae bacterium]|nr:ABC transporter ATP-binding protein [Lentisphaerota bacterium]